MAPGSRRHFRIVAPVAGTIPAGDTVAVPVRIEAKTEVRKRRGRGTRPQMILQCRYQVAGRMGMVSATAANGL